MGKTEWRASSTGPDVMDVMTMLAAIGGLHSAQTACVFSPVGSGSSGTVDIALSALFNLLPGSSLPESVGVHGTYPNKNGTSLWGEVYRLCWLLDEEISKTYKNEGLWNKAELPG